MAEYAIRAEGLVKSFRAFTARHRPGGAAGDVCALLGAMARQDDGGAHPDHAAAPGRRFRRGGRVRRAARAEARARIGVTGQGATVDELLTGKQNLRIVGS